jgi:hypothetical protein
MYCESRSVLNNKSALLENFKFLYTKDIFDAFIFKNKTEPGIQFASYRNPEFLLTLSEKTFLRMNGLTYL